MNSLTKLSISVNHCPKKRKLKIRKLLKNKEKKKEREEEDSENEESEDAEDSEEGKQDIQTKANNLWKGNAKAKWREDLYFLN